MIVTSNIIADTHVAINSGLPELIQTIVAAIVTFIAGWLLQSPLKKRGDK